MNPEQFRQLLEQRPDLRIIAGVIDVGAKVLDLGCGDGTLLYYLKHAKKARVQGIEISEKGIMECIGKGIPVYQGNLDEGLVDFADGSFDFVILSQTLQVVHNVELMMSEILRVGRKGIVSIPNFAYWKLRLGLLLRGRMPKSPMLPFEWYNTPNIRLLTIKDFRDFSRMLSIRIEKELFVEPNGQLMAPIYSPFPNWLAHLGIFVIAK